MFVKLHLCLFSFVALCAAASVANEAPPNNEIPAAKSGLEPIPLPQLDRLEEVVADQIRTFQQLSQQATAAQSVPDNKLAAAYGDLGQLYHAYELLDSAAACYRNLCELKPKDYRPHHFLADVYEQQGKLDKARDTLKKVRELQPDFPAAMLRLGNVYLQLNQPDKAREQFEAALETKVDLAVAHNGLGEAALAQRKYYKARHHFETALEMVPTANRIHYSLAMAYRGISELDKAREHLRLRGKVGLKPTDPLLASLQRYLQGERVHMVQGRLAFSAGRFREAAAAFAKAAEAKPDSVRALVNLGTSLVRLGEVPTAVQSFQTALKHDPKNLTALYNLGVLAYLAEQYDEAIRYLEVVVQTNPGDIVARLDLARALNKADRVDDALELYRQTMALHDSETVLVEFAELAIAQGQHAAALKALDRANRQYPSRGLTAHTLARLLATAPDPELRDGKRAIDLADKVYRAAPSPPHAETLALSYAEAGECDKAAKLQRQLIAIAEGLPNETLAARLRKDLVRYEKGAPCRPPFVNVSPPQDVPPGPEEEESEEEQPSCSEAAQLLRRN